MKKKRETESYFYFDITKQDRDSAIRFLLHDIIESRNDIHMPSNRYVFDEDVNVYLAHLLFAVSLPEYREMAEPYLSPDASDILNWVKQSEDKTMRYFIYKVNADHILLHTAVFEDLVNRTKDKTYRKTLQHYRELAKLYYDQAAAYHLRIYRKSTGVGDVLTKLSRYFEVYQETLHHMKGSYFHFVNQFRDQVFTHFWGEVKDYEKEFQKKNCMDKFLDLYGQWLRTKNPDLVQPIREAVENIRILDPRFNFDPNTKLFPDQGGEHEKKCA